LVALLLSVFIRQAPAQSNWYIDTLLFNVDYGGFGLFVSSNNYIGRNIWITAEIPYANSKIEYYNFFSGTYTEYSYKEFGNPYIGIRVWDRAKRFYNDVGIRYPFSDYSDRGYIGGLSNVEKSEAFQDDYITLEWIFNYLPRLNHNLYPRIYLGPLIYLPKSHRYDRTTEVFINYGFDIYIDHDYLGICFGLSGVNYATGEVSDTDNNETQLGFGPNFRVKKANFGLRLNTPLGADLNRYVDFAVVTYLQLSITE
jgi:hypothetical protein